MSFFGGLMEGFTSTYKNNLKDTGGLFAKDITKGLGLNSTAFSLDPTTGQQESKPSGFMSGFANQVSEPQPAKAALPVQGDTPAISPMPQIAQESSSVEGYKQVGDNPFSLDNVVAGARSAYGDSPMAKLAAAQAVLESRLLGKPSGLAREHFNLFGIKGKGTAGSASMMTTEHVGSSNVRLPQNFAKNKSIADSFVQHKNLMSKPRYKAVGQAMSFEDAAAAVKQAGYATDRNYTKQLIDIYNKKLSPYFDNPGSSVIKFEGL